MQLPVHKLLSIPGVTLRQRLQGHSAAIYSLAWSPAGNKIASSSYDGTVRIWEAESGREEATLEVGSAVFTVAWSPDGGRVVTGDNDKRLGIWDPSSGKCQLTLVAQESVIYGVDWSPDGRKIASGASDGTIYFWDAQSGDVLEALEIGGSIHRVAWAPDGRTLAVASWQAGGGKVILWDVGAAKTVPLEQPSDYELDVCWSPSGSYLVASSRGGIFLWQSLDLYPVALRADQEHWFNHALSFAPDERFLATLSKTAGLRLWSVPDLACVAALSIPGGQTNCLAFHPSVTCLALTDGENGDVIQLWNIEYGALSDAAKGGLLRAELKDRANLGPVKPDKPPIRPANTTKPASSVVLSGAEAKGFDIFLCHNAADKPAIRQLAERLKARGLEPWFDEWELRPGLPWQPALEAAIQHIKAAAVFVGQAGIGPWQQQELQGFLGEFVRRGCPVIPVLLPDAPAKPTLPVFLSQMTWVDFRKSNPDPLLQLIWGITGRRES